VENGMSHGAQAKVGSAIEEKLWLHLRAENLPLPAREFCFHPIRRWRFDFAYPDRKIAIECEGGIWTNGAHSRGKHFTSDCEKYNAAALMGWRLLRFTTDMVNKGIAVATIKEAL
jgi:very-short-patch-repair endonuclease